MRFRFAQAMFLWIVSVINTSLGKGADSLPFIGVLDIFGALSLKLVHPIDVLGGEKRSR